MSCNQWGKANYADDPGASQDEKLSRFMTWALVLQGGISIETFQGVV